MKAIYSVLIDVAVVAVCWRAGWLDTLGLMVMALTLAAFQIFHAVSYWRLKRYGEEIQRRMQSN
jgi:hypothetical protein